MTKFGVQLPSFSGFDPADLFEHVAGLATTPEEAGFDSVWVMDHFFQLPPLGGPDEPMLPAPRRRSPGSPSASPMRFPAWSQVISRPALTR